MSKLRDRIRRLARQESTPMGFARTAAARSSPGLLLMAVTDSPAAADEAAAAGADAVIFSQMPKSGTKMPQDALWGLRVGAGRVPPAAGSVEPDFLIVGSELVLDALGDLDVGIVVEADPAWPDAILQAAQVLTLDAIYARVGKDLTIRDLLDIRRLSGLAGPVLLELDARPTDAALTYLRDAGVAGLVLTGAARGSLKALREQTNAMPPRKRRRDDGSFALVPRVESHPSEDDDDLP